MPYKNKVLRKFEEISDAIYDRIPDVMKDHEVLYNLLYTQGSMLWMLYFFGSAQPLIGILPVFPAALYWYRKESEREKNYDELREKGGLINSDIGKSVNEYKQLLERQGALKEEQKEPLIEEILILPEEQTVEQKNKKSD